MRVRSVANAKPTENLVKNERTFLADCRPTLVGLPSARLHQRRKTNPPLSSRLIDAQEQERRRISRELHDSLGQDIAVLLIKIASIRSTLPPESDSIKSELLELERQTAKLGHKVRIISHNLHPAMPGQLGLTRAMETLRTEFEQEGLRVQLMLSDNINCFDEQVRLCLFRVAQEALRNAMRHSGTRFATLCLQSMEDKIALTIKDRGAGFDVEEKCHGLGLKCMQERVRLVQGSFQLRTAPGTGTEIQVT